MLCNVLCYGMFIYSVEPIHTVIINCAPISFMDSVGVKTLQQVRPTVIDEPCRIGVQGLPVETYLTERERERERERESE